jgi:threonine dehydrogenase-like Zn-dependent dehydrogenase
MPSSDASNAAHLPALALDMVEPGGRVVYIGLAGCQSFTDTRRLALKHITAVSILSASPGLADTIRAYATGTVDPRPLVAATIGLAQGRICTRRRAASKRRRGTEDPRGSAHPIAGAASR